MSPSLFNSPPQRYVFRSLLFALVYAGVTYLSLQLIPSATSGASFVWPVSAVGLAILLLSGLEYWPALIGSFFILLIAEGGKFPFASAVAISNLLEAIIGVLLLRSLGFNNSFVRFRDVFSLIVAAVISTGISSSVITGAAAWLNAVPFNQALWGELILGHSVSILAFAPFLISWFNGKPFIYPQWRIAEKVAVIGAVTVIDFLLFWTPYGAIGSFSLVYVLIIPLIWAAVRFNMRGMSTALALTGLIAATGVLFGYSGFTLHPEQSLFALQILVGVLTLIFLIFSSITEERRAAVASLEEHIGRLEGVLEQIRSSDDAKNEFIAILAHELRNPLAPIVSSVEILKDGVRPADEQQEFMGIIDTHVQTLVRLLDDLLDISRITQKKFHLQRRRVSLQHMVEVTLQTVGAYMKQRTHTLTLDLPKEPLMLDADPVRLEQALVNLLNNAAKYTEPGGTITLSAEQREGNVYIYITDTGMGIAPEIQHLIFEPFSSTSSMRRPGGLGVGLYLTKRLVELHGGTIGVISEGRNKGSKFIVSIPSSAGPEVPAAQPISEVLAQKPLLSPVQVPDAKTVLIVDDNEPAAKGLSTLLTHSGYTTHMAFTGADALEKAQDLKPGVVLLDIGLPDMEGYEVARLMRDQRPEKFTLIALTGYGQDNDKKRAFDAGFDHHLTKPVGIADVKRLLAA